MKDLILKAVPNGKTLYPFQVEVIEKTLQFLSLTDTHSCYNGSECGTGKTITSIVTSFVLESSRVLIIAPAIVRLVWATELESWDKFASICTILKGTDVHASREAKYVICSYALASDKQVLKVLSEQKFSLLIVDEAHCVKNSRAKRTSAVMKHLWETAKYRLLLSGTAMVRDATDLYVPLSKMLPRYFPSWNLFVNTYCHAKKVPWGTGIQFWGLKNADKLSSIIRSNIYIRVKKEDVLTELPPKIYSRITLPTEYSVKIASDAKFKELWEEKQKLSQALSEDKPFKVPSCLMEYRHAQGLLKVKPVAEFAHDLLEQEMPVLIFAWHKACILGLAKELKDFNPRVITGDTSSEERQKIIEDFQHEKTNCVICNIIAGGIGCSLQRANHVIMAELSYSAADNVQAESRAHRIGTRLPVNIYWMSVLGSLDEDVEKIVMQKTKDFRSVLDAPN